MWGFYFVQIPKFHDNQIKFKILLIHIRRFLTLGQVLVSHSLNKYYLTASNVKAIKFLKMLNVIKVTFKMSMKTIDFMMFHVTQKTIQVVQMLLQFLCRQWEKVVFN